MIALFDQFSELVSSPKKRPSVFDSNIRAITFDVGGTLIQPWPSVGAIYAQVASRHHSNEFDSTELNRRFIREWRESPTFEHNKQNWANLVDRTFGTLVSPPPSESFFDELYEEFAQPENWKVFEDAVPALDDLAGRGIPLAIVSNWDERLRPLLDALSLAGYFESILISSEIYFSKPSNVIFDHAIRNLGVPAETILHVGDNVVEDIQGARASGLNAMLIDRMSKSEPGRITSLSQLIPLLDNPIRHKHCD